MSSLHGQQIFTEKLNLMLGDSSGVIAIITKIIQVKKSCRTSTHVWFITLTWPLNFRMCVNKSKLSSKDDTILGHRFNRTGYRQVSVFLCYFETFSSS